MGSYGDSRFSTTYGRAALGQAALCFVFISGFHLLFRSFGRLVRLVVICTLLGVVEAGAYGGRGEL
jgi:hypothetical protein